MNIKDNLNKVLLDIPGDVTLVAVSKTKPNSDIMEAYEAGHRIFGENKVQELTDKYEALPKDIEWHMIGHLQRNKVKYIAPFVSLIHAVDSPRLLKEINKQARKAERTIPCLLQIHIAKEETKFGLDYDEATELLQSDWKERFPNIDIIGLMGMATFTDDEKRIRAEFDDLAAFFKEQRESQPQFTTLSMGMSGDYPIAIEAGSNMIRVGSTIFGSRNT